MLFSVEQVFVGREAIRAPLKTPVGEGTTYGNHSGDFQWGGGGDLKMSAGGVSS